MVLLTHGPPSFDTDEPAPSPPSSFMQQRRAMRGSTSLPALGPSQRSFAAAPPSSMQRQLMADPALAQYGMERAAVARPRRVPGPRVSRATRRLLWKNEVKLWLRQHDRGADWELPKAEEQQLVEWFNALDIDGSGSVGAEEIAALGNAVGVPLNQHKINRMFASIHKLPTDELKMHDFVKLMHGDGGGGILRGPSNDDDDDGGGGAGADENAGLLIVAYRRGRMLSDIRDPSKRAGFASKEAFARSYGKYRKDKPQHSPGRGGANRRVQ